MVLKKLVSFVYSLVGLRGPPRIKDATPYKTIVVDVPDNAKVGALASPTGSSSCETPDVEGEICCVCLSRLKIEEDTRVLPCMHRFHKVCIDGWFINVYRKTCPLCRFSVRAGEMCYEREERFTEEMVIWFSSFHVAGF